MSSISTGGAADSGGGIMGVLKSRRRVSVQVIAEVDILELSMVLWYAVEFKY